MNPFTRYRWASLILLTLVAVVATATALACGSTETVVQTVVVEKRVEVAVPQTVVVEKEVVVEGERVGNRRRRERSHRRRRDDDPNRCRREGNGRRG